jgi:hypothetical protein
MGDSNLSRGTTLSLETVATLCMNAAAELVDAPVGARGKVNFVLGDDGRPREVCVEFDSEGAES